MKTTWQEWQKHRRGLLGRQLDVASRYDEQAAEAEVDGLADTCAARPLGGAVDRKPRDDGHWDMIRRTCRAAMAERSQRWLWVGDRCMIIKPLHHEDERDGH